MRELSPLQNIVFRLGAVLMLAGLALRLFSAQFSLWLFGIGTMAFCLMRLQTEYLGRNFNVRRLRRQQLLGCVFFLVAVLFMSMQTYQYGPFRRNEWMIALAVACVLEVYTAWRLPVELENSKKS